MNVFEALEKRKSVRAFLDKKVEKETIQKILDGAKNAPSGVNMQPWDLYVVSGDSKKTIETKIQDAFDQGLKEEMDYNYYPLVWEEPFKSRRKETGLLMYKTLGITREDVQRQKDQWKANYRGFDAPVVIYCFIDKNLEKGSYLDYGMFIQSLVLSAVNEGLGTCIQAAHAEYPSIIKNELKVDEDKVLLCGIALGYEDEDALINSYRTSRIEIDDFATFVE
jgi:nitroreductase